MPGSRQPLGGCGYLATCVWQRALALLHERQRAEGVERDRGDEPLERTEQDALIDDLPDEGEDDARQTKDRPDNRITSLVTSTYPSPIVPTGRVVPGVKELGSSSADLGARREYEARGSRRELPPAVCTIHGR